MTHASASPSDLTKNQRLVFDKLCTADAPLSAYTLLDQLRDQGLRVPVQVYRALDRLVEFGLVHRLESLNAFVACSRGDCDSRDTIAFAICEMCGQVAEVANRGLERQLRILVDGTGFVVDKPTVELRGRCRDCVSRT